MKLRIYRTWTWEVVNPTGGVSFGVEPPRHPVPHDELQMLDEQSIREDSWVTIPIVEAEKPESPSMAKQRERDAAINKRLEEMDAASKISVDRSQTTLVDGSPVTEDHKELKPNGQQKEYVVLSESERAKGFVRPVRNSYVHNTCGTVTTMGRALSETYARDPNFYSGTFCCNCGAHFPVAEFVWVGTNETVGS